MFNFYNYSDLFATEEILIYLRKSRSDDPSLTVEEVLEKHEAMLDEWTKKHLGTKVPQENKHYEVVSGETIKERPIFQKVLKLIESPKVKAILCYDVSRLSRGDLEDAGRLIKLLRYTGTYVITLQKVYDLQDEFDREHFERELKRGNEYLEYFKKISHNGTLLSVQQGNYLGSIAPYGYDKTTVMDGKRKCPTLKINEAEANVVRMIFDMYVNQDMGRVNIAHRLNELNIPTRKGTLWSQDTIKTILENDHYIGKVRWNWRKTVNVVEDGEIKVKRPRLDCNDYMIYDGKHPAIVDEDIFYAAREKKGRNHKAKPGTKIRNPLAGLLFCQCGRAMSLRTHTYHNSPPRLVCDNQVYCHTSSCSYEDILCRVTETLQENIKDFEIKVKNDDAESREIHNNLIKRLKSNLEELNKKEISQWEKYSEEGMPKEIFDKLNQKVLEEKAKTEEALKAARQMMPEPKYYEERLLKFKDALDALKDPEASAEKKNRLLKACIERIDYNRAKAVRLQSKKKNVKIDGKRRKVSSLNVGASWSDPAIELNIKLEI